MNLQELADKFRAKSEGYGLGLVLGLPFIAAPIGTIVGEMTHSLGLGFAAGLVYPLAMGAAMVHYDNKALALENRLENRAGHSPD